MVLIAAEQKEDLVGIIIERAAAADFSPESPATETQFPWHSKCHAALPDSALINQLHCHNLCLVEIQMVHCLQHKTITAFSKA